MPILRPTLKPNEFVNGSACPPNTWMTRPHFTNGSTVPRIRSTRGKQVLYLTRNKGGFLKPCPGTREYTCCDYQILHVASFCTMDCSYCILQSYFHPPLLQFFVNREDLDRELTDFFNKHIISRVGTGEFTDSLIWERWTDLTGYLVSRFSAQDKAVLELKTKTVNIEGLRALTTNEKRFCPGP
jgi:spore photoproduct lyase